MFKYHGRIGNSIIYYHYYTDFIAQKRPHSNGIALAVMEYAIRDHKGEAPSFMLKNEGNHRVDRFLEKSGFLPMLNHLANLNYVAALPVKLQKIPDELVFVSPVSRKDLQDAATYLNNFYDRYLLYDPLTIDCLVDSFSRFPNYSINNIIIMKRNDNIIGVSIYYDSSEFVSLRIKTSTFPVRALTRLVATIHGVTGLLLEPPKGGEPIRTLCIKFMACDEINSKWLISHINNIAFEGRYHTISILHDERQVLRFPHWLQFHHRVSLYGLLKQGKEEIVADFRDRPVCFDITRA